MIEQQGRVIECVNKTVRVRIGGTSGCSACDAGKGCGAGVFGRLLRRKPAVLELKNTVNARRGQAVMVGIPETAFLALVARGYLYPLLAGLAGAMVAWSAFSRISPGPLALDLLTLAGGLAAAAWFILRNRRRAGEFPGTVIVHLLRVIEFQNSGK